MVINNLLKFGVICGIALVIYTSGIESGAAHSPSSSCNQNHLNIRRRILLLYIALNQRYAPVFFNALVYDIFTHGIVPHVTGVYISKHLTSFSFF